MEATISKKYINELKDYRFSIPDYQRGYRWTRDQITKLINDIDGIEGDEGYCLMPIIVRKKSKDKDGEYEVVDGQQRLTTIDILLSERENKLYKIGQDSDYSALDEELKADVRRIVESDKYSQKLKAIEDKLLNNCYFIWYEIETEDEKEAIDTFNRVNAWKIPLKESELIKAYVLSGYGEGLERREARDEWNALEHIMDDPSFFDFFNLGNNESESKYESCHIERLVELWAPENLNKTRVYPIFDHIMEKTIDGKQLFNELKKLERDMYNLYHDRKSYHLASYLLLKKTGLGVKEVIEIYQKNPSAGLLEKVRESIRDIKSEKELKDYLLALSYGDNNDEIYNILTLFNILSALNDSSSPSFYPTILHKKQNWSLEHIHARNERSLREDEIKEILNWNQDGMEFALYKFKELQNSKNRELQEPELNAFYSDIIFPLLSGAKIKNDEIDEGSYDKDWYEYSIGNLALLPGAENSALNNSTYIEKIMKIKNFGLSSYIPRCTMDVFMKRYSEDRENRQVWRKKDGDDYVEKICSVIFSVLGKEC